MLRASNLGSPVTLAEPSNPAARAYIDAARRLHGEDVPMQIPSDRTRVARATAWKEGGMTLFEVFRRRGSSAPVARERLQLLLAYERKNRHQPDLVGAAARRDHGRDRKHVHVDHDDVHVTMDRGETMSTLEIDIEIPNVGTMQMAASF